VVVNRADSYLPAPACVADYWIFMHIMFVPSHEINTHIPGDSRCTGTRDLVGGRIFSVSEV